MDQSRTAPLTPKPIMELATAFQRSRPLLTAFELGLFTTLNAEARTSEEIADALGTDPAGDRPVDERAGGARPAREARRPIQQHGARGAVPREGAAGVHGRPRAHESPVGHVEPADRGGAHRRARRRRRDQRSGRRLAPAVHRGDALRAGEAERRPRSSACSISTACRRSSMSAAGRAPTRWRSREPGAGISAVVFDLPNVIPLTRLYIAQEGLAAEVTTATGDYLTRAARRRVRHGVHVGGHPQQLGGRQPAADPEGRARRSTPAASSSSRTS